MNGTSPVKKDVLDQHIMGAFDRVFRRYQHERRLSDPPSLQHALLEKLLFQDARTALFDGCLAEHIGVDPDLMPL